MENKSTNEWSGMVEGVHRILIGEGIELGLFESTAAMVEAVAAGLGEGGRRAALRWLEPQIGGGDLMVG